MSVSMGDIGDEFSLYGSFNLSEKFLEAVSDTVKERGVAMEEIVPELFALSSNQFNNEFTVELVEEYIKDLDKKGIDMVKKEVKTPTRPHRIISSTTPDMDISILAAYGGSPMTPIHSNKRPQTTPDNPVNKRRSNAGGTPTPNDKTPNPKARLTPVRNRQGTTPCTPKYTKRANRLEVVLSHGDVKLMSSGVSDANSQVTIKDVDGQPVMQQFRYMFQKVQDRAHVLDRRIQHLTESILSQCNDDIELSPVAEKTSSEVYVSGQVCCDSEGRLNTESVLLQGCMNVSNGRCVKVDVSHLPSYSMFSGQEFYYAKHRLVSLLPILPANNSTWCHQETVILKGQNPDGNLIKATEILAPKPLPTPVISNSERLNIMVACGPFAPDKTDDYLPLYDLVDEVNKTTPHILILMGPFIDVHNQTLKELSSSYENLFSELQSYLSERVNSSTQIVVVSSHSDLHHDFIYPTPQYQTAVIADSISDNSATNASRILYKASPCTLDIGGVTVGLTSADVLFHMASNEISWNADIKDRMLRLSDHMLAQRSYFPLYPASTDINLDLELNEMMGQMTVSPHLLLVASDIPHFIKMGEKTVVINPGRLCKRSAGGLFLRLSIDPVKESDNIVDKFKADIVRI